ncbi:hypothetical protein FGO68_gene11799 [Halteria grandinella]|uniref:DNA-directed RNA polymerase RBP11-like dimerisation domain-containing protein n=1 Tax=Halteria grandinella TaxID=5974 RepID=A0A8J8NI41_HALGN|nr:hypothetical protein FGO68_gene11799 [Halteria grandinella]
MPVSAYDDIYTEKINYVKDSKIQNFANIAIKDEDHTLGNVVRMQLLKDPQVRFAGYRRLHPLENIIEIKVQTEVNQKSPPQAVIDACQNTINHVTAIEMSFRKAYEQFEMEKRVAQLGQRGVTGGYQSDMPMGGQSHYY